MLVTSKRIQKTVAQKKTKISSRASKREFRIEMPYGYFILQREKISFLTGEFYISRSGHIYICTIIKNMIQSARSKRKRKDSEDWKMTVQEVRVV